MNITEPCTPDAFASSGIDPRLITSMTDRGFVSPTPVQSALLAPGIEQKDLLVSAQTGSGKTVAFGLLIARLLVAEPSAGFPPPPRGVCRPRALVVAPTRELAVQVRNELAWLLGALGLRVLAVTGGTAVGGELRALSVGSEVVVGTPGRLVDHITRGSLDGSALDVVILDEGDEMLDMGFREELEAILAALAPSRKTWMFSATLPPEIVHLAKTYQRSPVRLAIDPPGSSNANIHHVCHVVPDNSRLDALVNVLLAADEDRTLVFVRTRIDAAELAASLMEAGFNAAALTGEMAQKDRTYTLDGFRSGRVSVLVATDVAARGLDVPEVGRVVHVDLPGDASVLTHRSGRTGRAGRQGTSLMLVAPGARRRAHALLLGAGVKAQWEKVPGVNEIRAVSEVRLRERLGTESLPDARHVTLAEALLAKSDPATLVAKLLGEVPWEGPCKPREVPNFDLREMAKGAERPRAPTSSLEMFRVNFGERQGATTGRLLAMLCRRGNVRGGDIGAIRVGDDASTFGVAPDVARDFARAVARPDKIDAHIRIDPAGSEYRPMPSQRALRPKPRYA